ncbi:uncharacterized protein FIESC28_04988 [Fusarium coffeatum]|nr:uncharacterized protein FIESC28_04988 [Fusarium coffeatum]RBR21249.1 hypothetical protein FIESC28_04988 [Fusarium coffeatum]
MFPLGRNAPSAGLLLLLASAWSPLANALDIQYCASFNTGETPSNYSIYQTNGLCHDFCFDDYAYAITQGKLCWCSNYAPVKSVQESNSDCNTPCPAWPKEVCGGDGVYGYVDLGNVKPSGSRGPSPSSTKSDSDIYAYIQIHFHIDNIHDFRKLNCMPCLNTHVIPARESGDTEKEESTSASATKATSTEEEEATSATETEEPSSIVQTVTAGGTIRTVTVAPTQQTAGVPANENTSDDSTEKSGLGTGQVVGIVVGVIAAVIFAAGFALFLWFRRKKQQNEQEAYQDDPSIRDSSSGIAQRPDMSTTAGSPIASAAAGSRNSTLQVDPRMDPFKQGLYVRSASHESINTLRDDHDYSRRIQAPKVLRATNPDPTPEP